MTHMAPETLMNGKISRASDVFAYGILLWELYTGTLFSNHTSIWLWSLHVVVGTGNKRVPVSVEVLGADAEDTKTMSCFALPYCFKEGSDALKSI